MWTKIFKAQNYDQPTYKHAHLPVYQTKEFDFFRCVQFDSSFYGKTASELHAGNLRKSTGRYAKLFPNQKLSYWANSAKIARAEVKKHGASNNLITFCAYDDTSSFMPTIEDLEMLIIIDGRECGLQALIDKVDQDKDITNKEQDLLNEIMNLKPDALAYDSHVGEGGENFIFFEKGFKKLSLKEVKLRLGEEKGKNVACITCAGTCDYTPYLESYGNYFKPKAKVKLDNKYLCSEEYLTRKRIKETLFDEKLYNRKTHGK